jgi:predicted dithiol-disulfide oxidoreductase (DUF899 family)
MVAVEKEYTFEGPAGRVTLPGLFGDSRPLVVQPVMFGPDWDAACPGCTAGIDEIADGVLAHPRTPRAARRACTARTRRSATSDCCHFLADESR